MRILFERGPFSYSTPHIRVLCTPGIRKIIRLTTVTEQKKWLFLLWLAGIAAALLLPTQVFLCAYFYSLDCLSVCLSVHSSVSLPPLNLVHNAGSIFLILQACCSISHSHTVACELSTQRHTHTLTFTILLPLSRLIHKHTHPFSLSLSLFLYPQKLECVFGQNVGPDLKSGTYPTNFKVLTEVVGRAIVDRPVGLGPVPASQFVWQPQTWSPTHTYSIWMTLLCCGK